MRLALIKLCRFTQMVSLPSSWEKKKPVFHDRSKHVEVRFHFVRDIIEREVIFLEKIASSDNPSDMGTKPLLAEKLRICHYVKCYCILTLDDENKLGMVSVP